MGTPGTRCYSCLAEAPPDATTCPRCYAPLALNETRRRVGVAFSLNALPRLVADGVIDDATAARIAAALEAPAKAAAEPRPAPVAAAERASVAAGPTRDALADQAPSLLLYVGAFLIVVSALIFVNVSGEQISDLRKLALMVLGTGSFLAAGVVCHRFPRVVPAGRTFLAIGALLVPIDVAATYALFLRESPFTSPVLWLSGSLVGAILYAALAVAGFGRWYARFFFVATVSAAASLLRVVDAPAAWWAPAFVGLGLVHLVAALRVRSERARPLTAELLLTSQIVVPIALVPALAAALAAAIFGGGGDRLAVVLAAALATGNYALLWDRAPARVAALATAGVVPLTVLYLIHAPAGAYAFTLLALAAVYALADVAAPRILPVAVAIPHEARPLAYGWAAMALAMVPHFEHAPVTGAIVWLGTAALFATIGTMREPRTGAGRGSFDAPNVYAAAATLHVGARYVLLALPFLSPAELRIVRDQPLGWAYAAFAASLVLAVAAAAAARSRPRLRDATAAAFAASALAVVALTGDAAGHRAAFAAVHALMLGAAAVIAGRPLILWASGAFAAVAGLALLQHARVASDARVLAVAAAALVLYAVGLGLSASAFARATREVAIAFAALGVVLGYALRPEVARDLVNTPLWQATILAALALAILLGAESRIRGMYELAVAASAAALGAVLMQISRLRPDDIQAYTSPVGVYLIALALLSLRYGPRAWEERVEAIEAAGAVVLVTPMYAGMWGPASVAHGVRLVVASIGLLTVGIVLRRRWPIAVAVGALGLAALRVLVDVFDRLPNWITFATAGAVLLGAGFVLLLKRELWERWRSSVEAWWRGWERAAG